MSTHSNRSFLSDDFINSPVARIIKWLFLIAAYGYLCWKLITFDKYAELSNEWKLLTPGRWGWLLPAMLMMPLNWLFEAIKWKLLTAGFENISLKKSYKGVLAGICTGFFTPNRVGEPVGRILYLKEDNRKAGITMSLVSSLTQTLVMTLIGLPAALRFFYYTGNELEPVIENIILTALAFLIAAGIFYFYLPTLSKKLSESNIASKVASYTEALSQYSLQQLLKIFGVSVLRYLIFCSQFYMVLHFFGIQLSPTEACIAIPTNYLFITYSPSFAFSEAVVRGSIAVLFIGSYASDTLNIALAGVFIWLINFIIPMVVGSFFVTAKHKASSDDSDN